MRQGNVEGVGSGRSSGEGLWQTGMPGDVKVILVVVWFRPALSTHSPVGQYSLYISL